MNYLKYFNCQKYDRENYNCWNFVQDVFKDIHNIELPNLPIMTDDESVTFLKSNIKYKIIDKPQIGTLIFVQTGRINHVGYCISNKQFIHKNKLGACIQDIPPKAIFYEVLIND